MRLAAALALLAAPALADETWTTDRGPLVYLDDVPPLAVLEMPVGETGGVYHVVVENLAGNVDARDISLGLWYGVGETGDAACGFALHNPYTGEPTTRWGRVVMGFKSPDWPDSDFVGRLGACEEEPTVQWTGTHD